MRETTSLDLLLELLAVGSQESVVEVLPVDLKGILLPEEGGATPVHARVVQLAGGHGVVGALVQGNPWQAVEQILNFLGEPLARGAVYLDDDDPVCDSSGCPDLVCAVVLGVVYVVRAANFPTCVHELRHGECATERVACNVSVCTVHRHSVYQGQS